MQPSSYKICKRTFDLIASTVLLVFLSPLLIIIGIVVFWFLGRPVLFRQSRSGLNGEPFEILKFRSMSDERDLDGNLLADQFRLGTVGRWLRELSLDELPSLINVVRGEMSLVGPRPLLAEYRDLYSNEQRRRLEVLPGVTGWAQVNGRNNVSWKKKFDLDVWYVNNCSLWLDLKIMFLTVMTVIRREGVNKTGFVTTDKFTGNEK